MSFRIKLLSWIVAVNLGITALLLVAVLSNINRQRQGYSQSAESFAEQRDKIFQRLVDLLEFQKRIFEKELADVKPGTIINWDEWRFCEDAMVLLDYVELDGTIVHTENLYNPLGRRHRTFDDKEARSLLEKAIIEDRPRLFREERNPDNVFIAIPIHLRGEAAPVEVTESGEQGPGRPSGGALVKPRFPPLPEPRDYFDWALFWIAMAGGTLVLILVTYTVLSRVVIRPVEEMAQAADRAAAGDFSGHCPPTGSRDEIGRCIDSFNYMLNEVQDYHQHLEEKVAEAQAKVEAAERHLRIAQRLAATGKLAAGIAHEINNPIGGMINAALGLKEKAAGSMEGDRVAVYIDLIVEGLERIKDIVRKVLAFTPRSLTPARVSLLDILKDAEAMVAHRVRRQEIDLEIQVEPKDLSVFCEPGEMRQVILNLMINALDAVEGGKGRITVRGSSDEEGGEVRIEIRDNGRGMDEVELSRAFDLFYTTKEAGKGTGLGLSLAHNIVVSHGGTIEAESDPGSGTRIRVRLPGQ